MIFESRYRVREAFKKTVALQKAEIPALPP